MSMNAYVVPLVLAISSLPAFIAAAMIGRSGRAGRQDNVRDDTPALARLMLLVGVAILAGAAGLLWAGDNETRRLVVIVAMVLAVNGLGLVLIFSLGRKRNRRP
ncbi:hypothetical protein J2X06_003593 [Lysobacter niastensis]|uniref:Uncharacterized protein n=2 Tax=Lysobacter niastensis TaxID=380629 RepID=A0ABU1WG71_9GAMM|nr:hypothetical protein [Lysobacter niastensis]